MPGLESLLAQVEGQFAHAFVVVGSGAFQLTGADGNRYEMPGIGEDELSATVEGTLDQDQLTDLMVGRPVGLSLDVDDARWRVLVEPGVNGLTVRGTRANPRVRQASQELEIELSDGASRPREAFASSATSGFGLVDPSNRELGEPSDEGREPTPPPGAVDAFDTANFVPPAMPDEAFGSGVFEAVLPQGQEPAPPGPPAASADGFGEVPLDPRPAHELEPTLLELPTDDDEEEGISLEQTLLEDNSDAAPASEGSTLIMEHTPVAPHAASLMSESDPTPTRRLNVEGSDHGATPQAPERSEAPQFEAPGSAGAQAVTQPRAKAPSQGTLMTMRPPGLEERMLEQGGSPVRQAKGEKKKSKVSVPRTPTGQHPRSEEMERGSLCFVRELSDAIDAGTRLGMGVEVIHDDDITLGRGPTVAKLGIEPGAALIVQIDDPSELLGWILLRREEGFRVFVVTCAMRPEGALRMLVGLKDSPSVQTWLHALPVMALVGGDYMSL